MLVIASLTAFIIIYVLYCLINNQSNYDRCIEDEEQLKYLQEYKKSKK
ncbi:hypothetical protein [Anaerocolumna sp. MB42-C2]|nr:hypothetical protein [Anaerocolumna sp. MB42-C2]WMJ85868.1 hypothetical protein RBU59_17575 [Anaerocolumna sp. MB42-C2]